MQLLTDMLLTSLHLSLLNDYSNCDQAVLQTGAELL